MKIAILILNWNNWRDTLACLDSVYPLLRQAENVSLVVCDNASQDDSQARIAEWASRHFAAQDIRVFAAPPAEAASPVTRFTLIQTGANLGFAGGNNVGIRYLLASGDADCLWLLNNDTTLAPDALDALLACARARPEVGVFGSTVVEHAQPEIVQCAGGCRYYPLWSVYRNALGGKPLAEVLAYPGEPRLDYIYGAAMFARADVFRRIGLLNEDYFLFYEELDFTRRLRKAGFQIAWCRNSLVYHKGGGTVGKPGTQNRERRSMAHYHENLSTLKYTANFHPRLLWLVLGLRFTLKSLVLMARREFFLLPSLVRAYRDFLRKP